MIYVLWCMFFILVIMLGVCMFLLFQIRRCVWELLNEIECREFWVKGFNKYIGDNTRHKES